MEKLKTYWRNNPTGSLIHLIGFLFFVFYGALTILFYKERTLSFDSAAFIFELIQTKTFVLPLDRWGSLFSQIVPLLFIKAGSSLATILKVYSFNFTILYYLGFLIITVLFKNYRIAMVYLLTLCLTYRNTFYFSASEFSQGLALVVILYAILTHAITQAPKQKQNIFFAASLLLAATLYYFHQLLVIPIGVVFCLLIVEHKAYKNGKLWLVFLGTIAWYGLKLLSLPQDSYESDKIPSKDVFLEQLPDLFQLPSYEYFAYHFQQEFIVVTIVFLMVLGFLTIKKHFLKVILFLAATSAYLLLIIITYYKGEGPNMYEQYYIVLGLFVALSIGIVIKEMGVTKPVIGALVLLMTYSSYKVYAAHKLPTKRLTYVTKLVEIGQKFSGKKYIILPEDYLGVYAWGNWAFPVETLMASSLYNNNNSVTIYVPDTMEGLPLTLENGQLHSAPWQKGLMNTNVLDTHYFKLPEKTNYLPFEKLRRDKYYFYELIKYDFIWMRKIRKEAEEENITVEESLWRNAEYMQYITIPPTPLEQKIQEIKSNEEWMESIKNKAQEHGISIDEMIRIDAEYSLAQEQ